MSYLPPRHPAHATYDRFGCPFDGPPSLSANRRTLGVDRVLRRLGGARGMRRTSNLGGLAMPALRGFTRARRLLCVLFGLVAMSGASLSSSIRAEEMPDPPLTRCNSIVSFDKRLLMEQWALPGHCDRPVRTRVTDQFLGFSCFQLSPERIGCRPFMPRVDSRALDTAKRFRCVDVAVMDGDGGIEIKRLREWAAPPKQCVWDPSAGVLAMEVDFEHSQVCLAAFCIDINRLSAIGMTRLRRLITSALEELNLQAEAPRPTDVYPAQMGLP
jgi:hypothetical protein